VFDQFTHRWRGQAGAVFVGADGRIGATELARRIGLSQSACLRRGQRLEQAGVIEGYGALLSHAKLGRSETVFIEITPARGAHPLALHAAAGVALARVRSVERLARWRISIRPEDPLR
jgi:DNA-binding Lrp family transcriptional regulator